MTEIASARTDVVGTHAKPRAKAPAWAEVSRASAKTATWVLGALLALGLPAGVAWAAFAPRMVWVRQGAGGYFRDSNSEGLVAADSWFFFLGIAIGVAAGLFACRLVRRHGPLVGVALAVGSLGGSYLAAVVGHWITLSEFSSTALLTADGKPMDYFLTVRAGSTIFAWPFAAELTLLLFTLWRWPRETPAPLAAVGLPDAHWAAASSWAAPSPWAAPPESSLPSAPSAGWPVDAYPVTKWPDQHHDGPADGLAGAPGGGTGG